MSEAWVVVEDGWRSLRAMLEWTFFPSLSHCLGGLSCHQEINNPWEGLLSLSPARLPRG